MSMRRIEFMCGDYDNRCDDIGTLGLFRFGECEREQTASSQ